MQQIEIIDDLTTDDMRSPQADAIIKDASDRLVSKFGDGHISSQKHEDFVSGYNWIKVTLARNDNPPAIYSPSVLCCNEFDTLEEQDRHGFLARTDLPRAPFTVPYDWKRNPFKDNNWLFHLSSWRVMDTAILRYFETGEPRMLQRMQEIALDWRRYWRTNRENQWTWYDMAAGIRALRLAFLLHESKRGIFKADDGISELAIAHAEKLMDEELVAINNHGLFQMVGLLALAPWVSFEQEAKEFAARKLSEIADAAFTKDGIHKEHSPAYHRFVQQSFLKFRSFYDEMPDLARVLRLAASNESWFTMPDGFLAAIGDTDHGKPGNPFNQIKSKDICEVNGQEIALKHFELGGYVVCRSLPDEPEPFALLVAGSKFSSTHKHADDLSFIFYWKGEPIFTDPGKFAYEYSDKRSYFLSAAAHSTVSTKDVEFEPDHISKNGSSISSVQAGDSEIVIEGQVVRPDIFTQNRKLSFNPTGSIVVEDEVRGGDAHEFESRLQLHPSIAVDRNGEAVVLTTPQGSRFRVSASHQIDLVEGLFSPAYNETRPCDVLCISETAPRAELTWTIELVSD